MPGGNRNIWCRSFLVAALLAVAATARAEIVSFQGTVRTTAQLNSDGAPVNADVDTAGFDPQREAIPIAAESDLNALRDGRVVARARSAADLLDPTGASGRNPGEYQFELGAFSHLPDTVYTVNGYAREGREVRFTLTDRGAASLFGGGYVTSVESSVFVGATLVFWSTRDDVSLGGTRAVVDVQVTDSRLITESEDGAVLSAALVFEGLDSGRVRAVTSDVEPQRAPLQFEILTLPALRGLATDPPPDADPLLVDYATRLVSQADAAGIRTLATVFLPDQELRYSYALETNRRFDLTAEFELTLTGAPDGVGVAAVMGRPFESLEAMLEESVTGVDGGEMQEAVNQLARLVAADLAPTAKAPAGSLCGAIGPIGASGMALSLVGLSLYRRRRMTRPGDPIANQAER